MEPAVATVEYPETPVGVLGAAERNRPPARDRLL